MKALGTKFALPVAAVIVVVTLVGVQAMALSQSTDQTPTTESTLTDPNGDSSAKLASEPDPTTTPMVIPTDGPTVLPSDDDDEFDDDSEEFEDGDDDHGDDLDDEFENENEDEGDDD